MKKLLAILMAIILMLRMTPGVVASAMGTGQGTESQQEAQAGESSSALPAAGKTITGIAASLGNPTGGAKDVMNIGDTFDVTFDSTAFSWSGTETAYSFVNFSNDWVKIEGPIAFVSATPNIVAGSVTVQVKTNLISTGTVKVYLSNGVIGADGAVIASAAYSEEIEVKDPVAEEQVRLADEASKAEAARIASEAEKESEAAEQARKDAEAAEQARKNAEVVEQARKDAETAEQARSKEAETAAAAMQSATASTGPATTATQPSATTPSARTMTKTVNSAGSPSNTLENKLEVGETFNVIFESSALDWSGNSGSYDFSGFRNDWVKLSSSTDVTPAKVKEVLKGENDGRVTVVVEAAAAFNGALTVALDSGNARTAEFSRSLAIEDNRPGAKRSMTETVIDGGNPASNVAASIEKDFLFDVVFDSTAFNWAGTSGDYDFGRLDQKWVKLASSTGILPVTVEKVTPDTKTGGVTVQLKAVAAFSGNLSVSLNSSSSRPTRAFSKDIIITADDSRITKTKAGGTAPVASHSGSPVMNAGDKLTFAFPENNFEWDKEGNRLAGSLTDTGWIKLNGAKIGGDFLAAYGANNTAGTVQIELTAVRAGTYKNLQVMLQGGGGAATTASAAMNVTVKQADSGKINGISKDARLGGTHSGAFLNGKAVSYNDLDNLEVKPEDVLLLPLRAGFFTWTGTAPYAGGAVTKSQINGGKVKVAASGRSGGSAFKNDKPEIYYSNGEVYVRIEFAKDAATAKDVDFSMTLYLSVDGTRNSDSALELAGTMARDVYDVDKNGAYADISDGSVVEAGRYVRNVELYLGEDVTAIANLSRGRKYSGTATSGFSREDERMIDEYPEIAQIYNLKTTGLSKSNCKIELDTGSQYYVYDENLEYIGKSGETLPYSAKYYLTTSRVNFDYDSGVLGLDDYDGSYGLKHDVYDDVNEPEDISWEPAVPLTPTQPANSNGNPKTGR